jgi:hypothetical protein
MLRRIAAFLFPDLCRVWATRKDVRRLTAVFSTRHPVIPRDASH